MKGEIARRWPEFRFSYSRPGFLTFKLPENVTFAEDLDLESVFTRAHSFSLGKVQGDDPAAMAKKVWEVFGDRKADRIHVWDRRCRRAGRARLRTIPHAGRLRNPPTNPRRLSEAENAGIRCRRNVPAQQPGRSRGSDFGLRAGYARRVVDRASSRGFDRLLLAGRNVELGIAARRRLPRVVENGRGPALVAVADPARRPRGRNRQRAGRGQPIAFGAGIPGDGHRSGRNGPGGARNIRISRISAAAARKSAAATFAKSAGSRSI